MLLSLGDRTGLQEVDWLFGGIECGGVAVLEADVIKVRIEGDALKLNNRARLVGGAALLFGQDLHGSAIRPLGVVEDLGGRNDAAGGDLTIDRPVALEPVVNVD